MNRHLNLKDIDILCLFAQIIKKNTLFTQLNLSTHNLPLSPSTKKTIWNCYLTILNFYYSLNFILVSIYMYP